MTDDTPRVTVRVDETMLADIDREVERGPWLNRSHFLRTAVQQVVEQRRRGRLSTERLKREGET